MTLEQRAEKLWPNHPAYQAAWLKMVQWLGQRWLLASQQQRKEVT